MCTTVNAATAPRCSACDERRLASVPASASKRKKKDDDGVQPSPKKPANNGGAGPSDPAAAAAAAAATVSPADLMKPGSNNERIYQMLQELADVEKVKGDSIKMNSYASHRTSF